MKSEKIKADDPRVDNDAGTKEQNAILVYEPEFVEPGEEYREEIVSVPGVSGFEFFGNAN